MNKVYFKRGWYSNKTNNLETISFENIIILFIFFHETY